MNTSVSPLNMSRTKRNIYAEIVIYIEALLIILYALILSMGSYWGIADNSPENRIVHIILPMVIVFCLLLVIQAIRVMAQRQRTAPYPQYIGALSVIIISPFIAVFGVSPFIDYTFDPLMIIPCVIGTTGLIWLSHILNKKAANSPEQPIVTSKKKRRHAYLLLLMPIIVFFAAPAIDWLVSQGASIDFFMGLLLGVLRSLVQWLSIPSLVAGIILLIHLRKS